jgi:hypothetical protein
LGLLALSGPDNEEAMLSLYPDPLPGAPPK